MQKIPLDIPDNIKMILPKEDIIIECDQEKLEITFLNLILNAMQAIGREKRRNYWRLRLIKGEENSQD